MFSLHSAMWVAFCLSLLNSPYNVFAVLCKTERIERLGALIALFLSIYLLYSFGRVLL